MKAAEERGFKKLHSMEKLSAGDKVYVAITGDGDPYGDFILGVFTERPDKEFIIRKYIEQHNSLLPEDDEFNRKSEDYDDGDYIFRVIEIEVS